MATGLQKCFMLTLLFICVGMIALPLLSGNVVGKISFSTVPILASLSGVVEENPLKELEDLAHNEAGTGVAGANMSVNASCPVVPRNLVGRLKVNTNLANLQDVQKRHPELLAGGLWRPLNCSARYKVAIVIPYRNRSEHLALFVNHMHPLLQRQQLDYGIFVVEQAGDKKLNRALLFNIGFEEALKLYKYDCFVFHDVDLLPEDDRNIYGCPDQPRHMSVAVDKMKYKLPYAAIFGGVSALSTQHFRQVNGFSNIFWGWGGEDDDMYNRIKYHGLKISRYPASIARYTMLSHKAATPEPSRYKALYSGKARFATDGLSSLNYTVDRIDLGKLYTRFLVTPGS